VASALTITESAPLARSSSAFSALRAAATMRAPGASRRAVRVIRTAPASVGTATMMQAARSTTAASRTLSRLPSPTTATTPRRRARAAPSASSVTATSWLSAVPSWSSRASAACPLVPKPTITVCPEVRRCHRAMRSRSRPARVATSIVVPMSTARKATRSGVTTRTLTVRAPGLTGVMSPNPVVEALTVA
jgi:hypothetical protein